MSIILLFAILFKVAYVSGMMANFLVNNAFFQERCENKDKPQLKCHGQCVLTGALKEVEPDTPAPAESRETQQHNLFFYLVAEQKFQFIHHLQSISYSMYIEELNLNNNAAGIFHPPKNSMFTV